LVRIHRGIVVGRSSRIVTDPAEASQPHGPLPVGPAWLGVSRCCFVSMFLLARGRVHLPQARVGRCIGFADGTTARVFRETSIDRPAATDACVLVVAFRLRGVRGRGHTLFERESLLNTVLFAGFPGLISKLWLAHDGRGSYRGLYEWDGPSSAEAYAQALWRVLALVSVRGSIDYQVFAGTGRDGLLADPDRFAGSNASAPAWSRVVRWT
jgi:hypothetical protein